MYYKDIEKLIEGKDLPVGARTLKEKR